MALHPMAGILGSILLAGSTGLPTNRIQVPESASCTAVFSSEASPAGLNRPSSKGYTRGSSEELDLDSRSKEDVFIGFSMNGIHAVCFSYSQATQIQ